MYEPTRRPPRALAFHVVSADALLFVEGVRTHPEWSGAAHCRRLKEGRWRRGGQLDVKTDRRGVCTRWGPDDLLADLLQLLNC